MARSISVSFLYLNLIREHMYLDVAKTHFDGKKTFNTFKWREDTLMNAEGTHISEPCGYSHIVNRALHY